MENQNNRHISINIMEELVAEEINRQISRYPENIAKFINKIEVATYALNRLPPLYASSQKGLNKQKLKGKSDFSIEITKTVRKAFSAVQKDILRYSTPLQAEDNADSEIAYSSELKEAQKALAELAPYFPDEKISWQKLVTVVKPLLMRQYQNSNFNSDSKNKEKKNSAFNRIMWF